MVNVRGEGSHIIHRCDSIQGTDYIANDFLNLRVFRTKIENLKHQIRRDIIQVTFQKFVTSLVQKLKILEKKLIFNQYLDSEFLLSGPRMFQNFQRLVE